MYFEYSFGRICNNLATPDFEKLKFNLSIIEENNISVKGKLKVFVNCLNKTLFMQYDEKSMINFKEVCQSMGYDNIHYNAEACGTLGFYNF